MVAFRKAMARTLALSVSSVRSVASSAISFNRLVTSPVRRVVFTARRHRLVFIFLIIERRRKGHDVWDPISAACA